ncbi:MAG: HAD family phosphatase [Lentisphaerae bacterium]|jgi:5-amino-6-(5-phospho-D-ribitylamino)uracil phosphatase|nr:HAD family phosphatase [Lentisphaerota bacterium]MBT4820785.1 HAD family phosphatase [Lentisphaerota bacterium]MBT5610570.1 HAD family phosphatase [Lentisphaerota bacterium]MBT7060164.1 HAD family phosphatase [Lentisphaerota bacterium]MBT7844129.1 HAD family phosphatase [Lentisphaerota bacterium]
MGYKLLILDVDGTFLTADKRATPAVKAAVKRLADFPFPVAFATGRMYEAIREWVQELGLRTPQICNNGADIIDPVSEERLDTWSLEPDVVKRLLDCGREQRVTTVLFSGSRVLGRAHSPDDWLIERNNETVQILPEKDLYAADLCVEKLLFLDRYDTGRIESVRDDILSQWPDTGSAFACQVSEHGILNFSHPKANKLAALQRLCCQLGIVTGEVIVMGDGDNDADILGGAGLGLAMANGSAAAKAAARRCVPDSDHDGVAVAIDEIIFPLIGDLRTAPPGSR